MNTLYDILGLSRQTTAAQIEQGYKFSMESLISEGDNYSPEDILVRSRSIKEAYAVLSSPSRRQAYDDKLKLKEQVSYEVVEKKNVPWLAIAMIAVLSVTGLGYYKVQAHKAAEAQRIAIETEKAKSEAEQAAKQAEMEQARLEQQILQDKRLADANQRREAEQARRDGQQIHYQLQAVDAQVARDKAQAERQAKSDKQREELAAQARSQSQTWAMQRALSIPIPRH